MARGYVRIHTKGWRVCPECRTPFKYKLEKQQYCHRLCRDRHYQRNKRNPGAPPSRYLDGADIAEIIELFDTGDWTLGQLAVKYSRSMKRIWDIVNVESGAYRGTNYNQLCKRCGTKYVGYRADRKYCSDNCRSLARSEAFTASQRAARANREPKRIGLIAAERAAWWRREDYNAYGVWSNWAFLLGNFGVKRPNRKRPGKSHAV